MAIFEPSDAPNRWQPSALAAGPFAGLQGGAVASLLTAEVEALAGQRKWGTAISASAWFLRPTPMAELRTRALRLDRRRPRQRDRQHAVAGERGSALRHRAGDAVARTRGRGPGICRCGRAKSPIPRGFRYAPGKAAHGRPWFMDAMEARVGDGVAWFRLDHAIDRRRRAAVVGAGPGGLDPRHRAAGPERGGRSEPEPDGPAVQAAGRRVGRCSCRKPGGDRRPGSAPEAACCSTSTARSAGSRCR